MHLAIVLATSKMPSRLDAALQMGCDTDIRKAEISAVSSFWQSPTHEPQKLRHLMLHPKHVENEDH